MTIWRVWRGTTVKSDSAKHLRYLKETGARDQLRTPGNLGVTILVRDTDDETEFMVISRWKSKNAIRKFAGDDLEKARYYPRDREFLLELEPKVKHYKVAFQARP